MHTKNGWASSRHTHFVIWQQLESNRIESTFKSTLETVSGNYGMQVQVFHTLHMETLQRKGGSAQ